MSENVKVTPVKATTAKTTMAPAAQTAVTNDSADVQTPAQTEATAPPPAQETTVQTAAPAEAADTQAEAEATAPPTTAQGEPIAEPTVQSPPRPTDLDELYPSGVEVLIHWLPGYSQGQTVKASAFGSEPALLAAIARKHVRFVSAS